MSLIVGSFLISEKKFKLFIPMNDFENRLNFVSFELSLENGYVFIFILS